MAETPLGRFVWYELLTTDPEAARAFYVGAMGWGVEVYRELEDPYPMFTMRGEPIAGLLPLSEDAAEQGARPYWLGYVTTPNVDAAVRRAEELRATRYVAPTDVGEIGRFAVIGDPQGAPLALYTPRNPPEKPWDPGIGEISWHELATTDLDLAESFYAELLGWEILNEHDMGEHGVYRIFGEDQTPYGGMFVKPEEMPAAWLYYVRVDDVDQAVVRTRSGEGELLNGPMEVPGGDRIAQMVDPQGAAFAVHEKTGT